MGGSHGRDPRREKSNGQPPQYVSDAAELTEDWAFVVRHKPVTDPHLTLADIGVYLRVLRCSHVACAEDGPSGRFTVRALRTIRSRAAAAHAAR
ncbi:hypothetical protein Scel_64780 [Streptomyces cellostaticus]|nr:hypothetical protein Scel_64780 [Streptomyces cellostaticus]